MSLMIVGAIIFIFFIRMPEIPLALLFNGIFIYFFIVYQSGVEINSVMTGAFYAFLTLYYLVGALLRWGKLVAIFKLDLLDILFAGSFLIIFMNYFIFSLNNEYAYQKIMYAPLLAIAPYAGLRLLTSTENFQRFFDYCVYFAVALVFVAIYELYTNPELAETTRFSMYKFQTRGESPTALAMTFAILLIILLVKYWEYRKLKFADFALSVPSAYLLLRTGSRGAVASLLIAGSVYMLFISKAKLKTKIYFIISIIILVCIAYYLIPESTRDFYNYTITPEAMTQGVSSINERFSYWHQAENDFWESPVMGVGFGNSCDHVGYPHNIVLEVAAEFGVMGLCVFAVMLFLTLKKGLYFIKNEKEHDLSLFMNLALFLFLYSLTEAMVGGYITNQTRLYMSMGLIVSISNSSFRQAPFLRDIKII